MLGKLLNLHFNGFANGMMLKKRLNLMIVVTITVLNEHIEVKHNVGINCR